MSAGVCKRYAWDPSSKLGSWRATAKQHCHLNTALRSGHWVDSFFERGGLSRDAYKGSNASRGPYKGVLGVTIGAADTLIDDPRCPEAATLVTDGVHLALYDHHAVCIGRFIMIVHPVLQEGVYDTINGWMPLLTRVHAAPEVPLNAAWQSGLTSFEVGYTLQSSPLPFPRGLRQDGHPETQRDLLQLIPLVCIPTNTDNWFPCNVESADSLRIVAHGARLPFHYGEPARMLQGVNVEGVQTAVTARWLSQGGPTIALRTLRSRQMAGLRSLAIIDVSFLGHGCQQIRQSIAHLTNLRELILPGTTAAEAFRGASEALKTASPVGAVLAGLTRLDLSRGIATMAAADAVALLCACPALRHFSAPDVKVIDAETEVARGLSLCIDSLPSLLTLRVGWGFGGAALQTLCGSSTSLTELQTGVGASLSDWGLTELVRVCPHLRSLTLGFANITDSGVNAALQGLSSLETLQLLQCSGPFTDALGESAADFQGLRISEYPRCIRNLHIISGATQLSHRGVRQLLGRVSPEGLCALHLVGLPTANIADILVLAAEYRTSLVSLRLERVGAADHVRAVRRSLEPDLARKVLYDEVESGLLTDDDVAPSPTYRDKLEANLLACEQLRYLVLRHCWGASASLFQQLRSSCLMLRELGVDECDVSRLPLLRWSRQLPPWPATVTQLERLEHIHCTSCTWWPPLLKWAAREKALSGYCDTLLHKRGLLGAVPKEPFTSLALCLQRAVPKSEVEFLRT